MLSPGFVSPNDEEDGRSRYWVTNEGKHILTSTHSIYIYVREYNYALFRKSTIQGCPSPSRIIRTKIH